MLPLNQIQIRQALKTKWIGRHIFYYPVVGSTNELLKRLADQGSPEGTVLITDYQRKGKGRRGRSWQAPARSSLLFSVLLQPSWPLENIQWLTMIAGIATIQGINQVAQLQTKLKWPNDIVVAEEFEQKKLGGILIEVLSGGSENYQAIVGIGINVNIAPDQLPDSTVPSTSILVESGSLSSRLDLLTSVLKHLENRYEAATAGLSPQPEWNKLLTTIGQSVEVRLANNTLPVRGIAVGTEPNGRLIIRDEHGQIHKFLAGDVTKVS